MMNPAHLLRAIACALALAAALGVARAAGPHVLDVPAVANHVASVVGDAEPPLAKAYRKLGRKLRVRGAASLSRDIRLLRASAKAAAGTLMSDETLGALVSSRADAADAALAARPDDVEAELTKVGRASDRAKVNGIRDVALDLLAQGRLVRDAENEAPALVLFAKSSAKFDAAIAMAKRIVKGQGGPLPQFKDGAR